eukprot:5028167-Amphidinium_carterae.1
MARGGAGILWHRLPLGEHGLHDAFVMRPDIAGRESFDPHLWNCSASDMASRSLSHWPFPSMARRSFTMEGRVCGFSFSPVGGLGKSKRRAGI